ncbi:DUF3800 domain-containing protein [Sphingomonas tabacisoli]|uniref:DUF3800 domain-containing protein n=1 Tax=Sphingomonas tabacisoli TaxID=2249466 RepID=A0ABW4I008_9SPHN
MEPLLSVFIDEAGDPGVKDGLFYRRKRHEWLCLAAVVVRRARATSSDGPVGWVRNIRALAGVRQRPDLHYARVAKERRLRMCAAVADLPIRGFVIASHKSNMREHVNPRLGKLERSDQFYNWCMRLLLERVTRWAATWSRKEGLSLAPLDVTFARRGGHDYEHMFSYFETLRMQVAAGTLILKAGGLACPTVDQTYWKIDRAEKVAGCQLADTIASAFYQAANASSPAFDVAPAKALSPIIARGAGGGAANLGVTVWPLPHQAPVPIGSRSIFEHFGYRF